MSQKNQIKVIGSGCPTCKELHSRVSKAASELGIGSEVVYITDIMELTKLGGMQSPGLVINDKLILAGSLPDISELKTLIQDNLN